MSRVLSTSLPGTLEERLTLSTTLIYRSSEPQAVYRFVAAGTSREQQSNADGIAVQRHTGEQNDVRLYLVLAGGSQYPVYRLTVVPQDVRDFLEQYAPEAFA
jgi:hypothetical protein